MKYILRNTLTLLLGCLSLWGLCLLKIGINGAAQTTTASAPRPMYLSSGVKLKMLSGVYRSPVRLPLPLLSGKIRFSSLRLRGNALVLMCISTEGEELWKQTVGHGNRSVRGGEGNSAAPSPVTDGEHVWAFLGTGDLVCYDFDGNQVWHTNLAERYGSFNLYFVMSTTPLIDKDRLYIHLIHSNAWLVLALDKMDGQRDLENISAKVMRPMNVNRLTPLRFSIAMRNVNTLLSRCGLCHCTQS